MPIKTTFNVDLASKQKLRSGNKDKTQVDTTWAETIVHIKNFLSSQKIENSKLQVSPPIKHRHRKLILYLNEKYESAALIYYAPKI